MNQIKGYKAFNKDWTCRGKQYKVGELFEEDVELEIGVRGMHFCRNLADCFAYYEFDENTTTIAEVLAIGDVLHKGDLSVTNKLVVLRELTWGEVLKLANSGYGDSGYGNSGDCNSGYGNSGNWNSGNWNSGYGNSGDCNSGHCNSGDGNSGDGNSGDWNSGSWNSGNWNSGNWNSGDWNATNYSSGCFNTEKETIRLFNQPSKWTLRSWYDCEARKVLSGCPNATNDRQEWWDDLDDESKAYVIGLPNFDKAIFKECTGIEV